MSKLPLIGISCDYEPKSDQLTAPRVRQNQDYATRIVQAGGLPVMLPLTGDPEAFADTLDGWLIPGGNDISPAEYGRNLSEEELKELSVTLICNERFEFEKRLYKAMRERGKPILGICYGSQLINVLQGGTLIIDINQELPTEFNHRWKGSPDQSLHEVEVCSGTLLFETTQGNRFECVSSHHQSVQNPGNGLKIAAYSPDGVVEAIEGVNGSFLLGVQWHPERQPDSPFTQRLFQTLIDESRKVKSLSD